MWKWISGYIVGGVFICLIVLALGEIVFWLVTEFTK